MKPQITIEDFTKLDLRVGEVVAAEEVPGSGKLVKLIVNFQDFTRIIYSGIKKWYSPEDLSGRKFIFVVNLAPRTFKIGDAEYVSEGMILAACLPAGRPPSDEAVLYNFDKEIKNGTAIR